MKGCWNMHRIFLILLLQWNTKRINSFLDVCSSVDTCPAYTDNV